MKKFLLSLLLIILTFTTLPAEFSMMPDIGEIMKHQKQLEISRKKQEEHLEKYRQNLSSELSSIEKTGEIAQFTLQLFDLIPETLGFGKDTETIEAAYNAILEQLNPLIKYII